ncbi:MAG: DUF2274 domain-containing protein [Hyphomonas sp.]
MTQPSLKIGPLPGRTPLKISVLIDPALKTEPETYAAVYAEAYGSAPGTEALVPAMLETFLASDAGFRRAGRAIMGRH